MIARIWHGRLRAEEVDEYVAYVEETGIKAQRGTPGNLASMILTRGKKDEAEIVVLSLWESMEAVRAFAGQRPEIAVYYVQDAKYLLEFEPEVHHYEVPAAESASVPLHAWVSR